MRCGQAHLRGLSKRNMPGGSATRTFARAECGRAGDNESVKLHTGTYEGVGGGRIFFRHWLPEEEARAVLVLVHGLGEHGGRYENVARHFSARGYAVCAHDHPGHGKSDGVRSHIGRFSELSQNLQAHVARVRGSYPGRPMFLLGHSMGGLVALDYLLEEQDGWAGAVLTGPALRPVRDTSPVRVWIGRIFSVVAPRVRIYRVDASTVCRDPEVVAAYRSDPLVFRGMVTARLAAEILRVMRWMSGKAARIKLPLLIMQGGADRVVDPEGATWLGQAVDSRDKTLKIYEAMYHEILNEPEHGMVWQDIEMWLEKRMA